MAHLAELASNVCCMVSALPVAATPIVMPIPSTVFKSPTISPSASTGTSIIIGNMDDAVPEDDGVDSPHTSPRSMSLGCTSGRTNAAFREEAHDYREKL